MDNCGSGHAREAGDAVDGTGCAGVRGRARSHKVLCERDGSTKPVGAALAAKGPEQSDLNFQGCLGRAEAGF